MVTVDNMRYSLPLVVGEGDSLRGHFEVDHGGHWWRVGTQSHGGGLLHRLDTCQGLHFHGAQVPNVTGCKKKKKKENDAHWCLSHIANTFHYDGRDGERNRFMMMFKEEKLITCTLFEQLSSRVGD